MLPRRAAQLFVQVGCSDDEDEVQPLQPVPRHRRESAEARRDRCARAAEQRMPIVQQPGPVISQQELLQFM